MRAARRRAAPWRSSGRRWHPSRRAGRAATPRPAVTVLSRSRINWLNEATSQWAGLAPIRSSRASALPSFAARAQARGVGNAWASMAAIPTSRSVPTNAAKRSGRRWTSRRPIGVPAELARSTSFGCSRCARRNSLREIASSTIRSKLISPQCALPLRPSVLPAPRRSHWTTVKERSQERSRGVNTEYGEPGPPWSTRSTGLRRSSPRKGERYWYPAKSATGLLGWTREEALVQHTEGLPWAD